MRCFYTDPADYAHRCNIRCQDGMHAEVCFVDVEHVGRAAIMESLQGLEGHIPIRIHDFDVVREPPVDYDAFAVDVDLLPDETQAVLALFEILDPACIVHEESEPWQQWNDARVNSVDARS